MSAGRPPVRLTSMTDQDRQVWRVAIRCVGAPPTRSIERASGVSEVVVDGPVLRCLVSGSFQPFLEALRGHEVISLTSRDLAEDGTDPIA
jgi:hypothetical protein